jgi:hypothetical protein
MNRVITESDLEVEAIQEVHIEDRGMIKCLSVHIDESVPPAAHAMAVTYGLNVLKGLCLLRFGIDLYAVNNRTADSKVFQFDPLDTQELVCLKAWVRMKK